MTITAKRLKVGVAGLGRMGKRHATNFLNRTPRAELVAVFTPDPEEFKWGQAELEPYGVKLYDDYDKMIDHEGLEAVVVSTVTAVHAEESIKALNKNLHVLCEKPLSTELEISQKVVEEARKRPDLKVMCGFSRRFDESYREAYRMMQEGKIGRPSIMRSQTCDKHDPSGFFVQYAAKSGGIFVDCNVHDIDLCLWFFGPDVQPKSVSAHGITAIHPELRESGDRDNAVGVIEFYSGQIAYFFSSRMMAHGQEDTTEIIGTEGKLSVNTNPQKNFVNHYHPGGITREIPANYYGRFEMAFVAESNEFTAAVLDDKPAPLDIAVAHKALQFGKWLQESMISNKPIYFSESGERISEPKA